MLSLRSRKKSVSRVRTTGYSPRLIKWAFCTIMLDAAWRKTSVSVTDGTAPLASMSFRTLPAPTEGS